MTAHVCPPEHPHAQLLSCYQHHGCRCTACCARAAAAQRLFASNGYVPAAPVRAHLQELRRAGAWWPQIAAAADVPVRRIEKFLGSTPATTHADFAAAVLAVSPARAGQAPMRGLVPARGALRRIRALYAHGWSFEQQASIADVTVDELRRIRRGKPFLQPEVGAAIRRVHSVLWDVAPPMRTPEQRRAVEQRRRRAARLGYVPTLAWDDIDTDPTPPTVPPGEVVDELAIELALEGEDVALRPLEQTRLRRIRRDQRSSHRKVAA